MLKRSCQTTAKNWYKFFKLRKWRGSYINFLFGNARKSPKFGYCVFWFSVPVLFCKSERDSKKIYINKNASKLIYSCLDLSFKTSLRYGSVGYVFILFYFISNMFWFVAPGSEESAECRL